MADQVQRELEPKKEKIRIFNLRAIEQQIARCTAGMLRHYGTTPVGAEFDTFVGDFYQTFPPTIRFDVFFASIMHMVGKPVDRNTIKKEAWRLAGNLARLKAGEVVPPWARQKEAEWAPIQIGTANVGWSRYRRKGFFYQYRILAGLASGLKGTAFWTIPHIRYLARFCGFTGGRSPKPMILTDGREFVGLRLYLRFDPELSKEDRPGARRILCPPSCRNYNREILLQRFRHTPCPLGYMRVQMQCIHCPMGFNECIAGTHPATWKQQGCPRCMQEAWFDPLSNSGVCVICENEKNERPEKKHT